MSSDGYPFLTETFRGRCVRVVDGDTIDVVLDAGFRTTRTERLRLLGVDTPELRSADATKRQGAQAAKDKVAGWLLRQALLSGSMWPLKIRTVKADSFGRYLADVWWMDEEGQEHHVNQELLTLGLAVPR